MGFLTIQALNGSFKIMTVFNHRFLIQVFPGCEVNLVISVKSFVGVRLRLSEPDKEERGAPGQPCYITFENSDQNPLSESIIRVLDQDHI